VKPHAIYLTDNGRALCGDHLGASARYTGRDISGQEIMEISPDMLGEPGVDMIRCESCGRRPSRLWVAS
jgi:hypothetical protein